MNYNIEDFTIDRYKDFLIEARDKFAFSGFNILPSSGRHILLRHDLDLSIQAAWQIALAEYEYGVKSTYFLLMHSPFYNLFDKKNYSLVQEIIKMGHHIGLHFDSHFHNIDSESQLEEKIALESHILNDLFNIDIKVFSFHLTNQFTMNCKANSYGGLINTYSDFFQSGYSYCSDSYGLWRFSSIFDFIQDDRKQKLQILTHPEWWVHEPSMPAERIKNIINGVISELESDADKNYIYKEAK